MSPADAAAAADIHAAFASLVDYLTPACVIAGIGAVRFDEPAGEYSGAGATKRRVMFELQQSDVAERPGKDCQIREHDGARVWRIIEVTRRDDVGAWECVVEGSA